MKVPYNYLPDQFADVEDYFKDLRELVKSGEFTLGPYVERFEKRFAEYIGVKHVISTNTGTDALILCLRTLGIGINDEVITVANTFYATVGAIVAVGAKPVFVDCDERMNIDPALIEKAITKNTKAILPVHWAGLPPEMDKILAIAKKHNLKVIEDACPAVGAKIHNKYAGTFGDINAFSMHPLKPLNVWGDGGMVATNNDEYANWLRKYRNHGMVDRDHIDFWGINSRLQPVQAVVAYRLMDTMEHLVEKRIHNANLLDAGLKLLNEFIKTVPRMAGYRDVFQLYLIQVKDRDNCLKYLLENGIDAKVHYRIPLHLQKPGTALGYKRGDFPVAEKQADSIITLPAHQHVNDEQIALIIKVLKSFYKF